MKKFLKVIISLAISSWVPAIALAIAMDIGFGSKRLYLLLLLYKVTFAFSLYVGLPLFYIADKLKLVSPGAAILVGLFVGFIPASNKGDLTFFYIGLGALTGYVFWLIWDYLNRRYGCKAEAEARKVD